MATGKPSADESAPLPVRLVAVASRLFADQGFENTSVQEIVQAAGVTKGAMYHHFGSKEDLLVEIYHRMLAMQLKRLERIAGGDAEVADRLHRAVVDVVVTTVRHRDDAVVFFRSMHLLDPAKRAEIRAERRRYHELFRGLIEQGQRANVFRGNVSADIATHNFFGGVHHLDSWYQPDGTLSPQQVGEQFADLLLHALAPAIED
ncbi:TetR/AcrR family transcriptional regulator [Amycolatopsis nigrescens]|uniref:TetR/AcrR family transcriptional regulator n=1 Tax=Amycolatopsis nigrescens TaxID=381445 RepID=UPI0003774721|nr:TetR/AcrR family transcriptional regulator [Amycolatopsis nigrescens]